MNKIVVTCEHGGNEVPEIFQQLFQGKEELLQSHRGYDIGALPLFDQIAGQIADFSHFSTVSRLLVELNRSVKHPKVFSEITQELPEESKQQILDGYYEPYRKLVEKKIKKYISEGHEVIHISVHTFTPALEGEERKADIGLLYHPDRKWEKALCENWKTALHKINPTRKVRSNYPYLGKSDGFISYLRKWYGGLVYAGIELEVNQKFFLNNDLDIYGEITNALAIALEGTGLP